MSLGLATEAISRGEKKIRMRHKTHFTPGPWAVEDLPTLLQGSWHNCLLASKAPCLLGMAKKSRDMCRELMDSAITDGQKALLHKLWLELYQVIDNAEGRDIAI